MSLYVDPIFPVEAAIRVCVGAEVRSVNRRSEDSLQGRKVGASTSGGESNKQSS